MGENVRYHMHKYDIVNSEWGQNIHSITYILIVWQIFIINVQDR